MSGRATKCILDGTELDRSRSGSLESSRVVVVVLGRGRRARDTSSDFTVLVLYWVESVLYHQHGSR